MILSLVLISGHALASDNKNESLAKSTKDEKESAESKPEIKNFGKVDDHFFRGAQPRPEDYPTLARIGVRTIIDLRNDPKEYAKESAERAGLRYISFPLSDKDYPAADSAEKFLGILGDGNNWPVYIHCAGGRHRTGIMTAVYRMTVQGWDIEKAYGEMKEYDFYTRWGHGSMKDLVFDYFEQLKATGNARRSQPILVEAADQDKEK